MGTLGNVPLASAHGRCTTAALSCIQWKAHHEFHGIHHEMKGQKNSKFMKFLNSFKVLS